VLAYLDVPLMGHPEMFVKHDTNRIDATGTIVSEDTRKFLQNFVDKYVAWVQRLATV
jgi:chromate reductase